MPATPSKLLNQRVSSLVLLLRTLIVAAGTSCRHQIADGAARQAVHLARVLDRASEGT